VYSITGERLLSFKTTTIPRVITLDDINFDEKDELICGGEGTIEIYRL